MRRYLPLFCLTLIHALVDACAVLIGPLWPSINRELGLSAAGLAAAFLMQSLPTNGSQMVFGWLRDRWPMPAWVWLGPLIAAVVLPLVGLAPGAMALFALLAVGGIAVGAFHPEGAVAAGRIAPEIRTRAMALFMFGGTVGMMLGPLLSGWIVPRWGLPGLVLISPLAVAAIILLTVIGGLGRELRPATAAEAIPPAGLFGGRDGLAFLLLVVCSLRLVPNMAMDKVLSFLLEARGASVAEIGRMQSLLFGSASAGMLGMALWFRPGRERLLLIATPLLAIPLLWLLGRPNSPTWLIAATLPLYGVILWGTSPAMVSYAQQQFPNGAGFASALTMGFSWGVAGLIHSPITARFNEVGNPGGALTAYIPLLVLSAGGACLLPRQAPAELVEPEIETNDGPGSPEALRGAVTASVASPSAGS